MIIKTPIPGNPKPSAYVNRKIYSSSNYPFNSQTPLIVPGDVFTVLSFEKDSDLFICFGKGAYFTASFKDLNGILSGAVIPHPVPASLMRALSTLNYMFLRHVFKGDINLEYSVLHEINDFLLEVLSDESLLRNNAYKAVISEEISAGEYVNNLKLSEAKEILYSYFMDVFEEEDAVKMTDFYIDLIPNSLFAEPENKIVNASIDISFEVDPTEFGLDPRKAVQKAVLNQMYAIEGSGEIYDWSIRELYDEGVPFSNEFIMKHGVPTSPNNIEFSLPNEAVEKINFKGSTIAIKSAYNKDADYDDYPNSDELMLWIEVDGQQQGDVSSFFFKKGSLLS